jgi:hypothetical protein
MNRSEILKEADRIITKDRAATHGDAENSFSLIADLWSSYLGTVISSSDVAMLMVLFKAARFRGNPGHIDNAIDLAGYAALAGEISGEA